MANDYHIGIGLTVNEDDINRFIQEKNCTSDCPSCAANDWLLQASEIKSYIPITIIDAEKDDRALDSFNPCFALLCGNCGFMKLYSKVVVSKWKYKEYQNEC